MGIGFNIATGVQVGFIFIPTLFMYSSFQFRNVNLFVYMSCALPTYKCILCGNC